MVMTESRDVDTKTTSLAMELESLKTQKVSLFFCRAALCCMARLPPVWQGNQMEN